MAMKAHDRRELALLSTVHVDNIVQTGKVHTNGNIQTKPENVIQKIHKICITQGCILFQSVSVKVVYMKLNLSLKQRWNMQYQLLTELHEVKNTHTESNMKCNLRRQCKCNK